MRQFWIEQSGDYDHSGGGADVAEELAVDAAYDFPVFDVCKVQAGADYILEGCAGFGESFFGDGEDAAGLAGGIFVVCAYGAGSGKVDGVADAHGAGKADDGLEG